MQVTGVLADALNWAGISEDEFNEKLAACTSESERNQLIMDTLSTTYDEASDAFYRNNEALVASREAQAQMDSSLAELGHAVSDVKTRMLGDFLPSISQVTSGLAGMLTGVEGADEQFSEGIGNLIDSAVERLPEFLDFGLQIVSSVASGIVSNIPLIASSAQEVAVAFFDGIGDFYPFISPITGAISTLIENFDNLLPVIVAVTAATKAYSAAVMVLKIIDTVTKSTEGLTVAQSALNAIMAINPFVLVATAVVALVAAIATLWATNEDFRDAVTGAWETISSTLSSALSTIYSGVQSTIDFFRSLPGEISSAISNAVNTISEWGSSVYKYMTESVESAIMAAVNFFYNLPENIGYALGYALGSVIKFGQDLSDWVTNDLPEIIRSVVSWFSTLPDRIFEWLYKTISNISKWGENILSSMSSAAENSVENVINWFETLPGRAQEFLSNSLSNVKTWGKNLIESASQAAENTVSKISDWFEELPDRIFDIGVNIVQGLWNGITSMGGWIKDKIDGFFDGIVSGAKDALGIHSPSTVFRDQIGKNIGLGTAEGITRSLPDAKASMNKMSKELVASIPAAQIGVYAANQSMAPMQSRYYPETSGGTAGTGNGPNSGTQNVSVVIRAEPREMAHALVPYIESESDRRDVRR